MRQDLWQPLQNGDKVAFLPSSIHVTEKCQRDFAKVLDDWGLQIYSSPVQLQDDYFFRQGTPSQRANAIIDVLKNDDVKALFISGGSGAEEVIEHLKRYDAEFGLPKRAIPLIGYSDATQLQHYLSSIGVVCAVQGCDPRQLLCQDDFRSRVEQCHKSLQCSDIDDKKKNRLQQLIANHNSDRDLTMAMHDFLTQGKTEDVNLICINDAARNSEILSGNLVVFNEHSSRSDYRVLTQEEYSPIFLLEAGIGGRKVKEGINFAVNYLKKTGQLNNLQAIVISQSDAQCFFDKKLDEVDLSEITQPLVELDIPVFFGAPFGHGPISFRPLSLDTKSKIAVMSDGSANLSYDTIRKRDNAATVEDLCAKRKSYQEQLRDNVDVGVVTEKFLPDCLEISADVLCGDASGFSGSKNYLACKVRKIHRGFDLANFDLEDLYGKDILICLDQFNFPSFQQYKKQGMQDRRNQNKMEYDYRYDYHRSKFTALQQYIQMPLMSLITNGKLQEVNSLLLAYDKQEFPSDIKKWLNDFAVDYGLNFVIAICHRQHSLKDVLPNNRSTNLAAQIIVNSFAKNYESMPDGYFTGNCPIISNYADLIRKEIRAKENVGCQVSIKDICNLISEHIIRGEYLVRNKKDILLKAFDDGLLEEESRSAIENMEQDELDRKFQDFKGNNFRKRSASEIIESGFSLGCTEDCLVFLAVARQLGIKAVFVETIRSDDAKFVGDGSQGHCFAKVCLENCDENNINSWIQFDTSSKYSASDVRSFYWENLAVAIGKDFSSLYLLDDNGKALSDASYRIDSENKIRAIASQFNELVDNPSKELLTQSQVDQFGFVGTSVSSPKLGEESQQFHNDNMRI